MSTFFAIIFGIIFRVIHGIYTITHGFDVSKVAKTVTGHCRPLVDTVKHCDYSIEKHFFFDFRTALPLYCNAFILPSQLSISTENYTLLHTIAHTPLHLSICAEHSIQYVCTRVMHIYTRTRVMYNFHDPIFMCNFSV